MTGTIMDTAHTLLHARSLPSAPSLYIEKGGLIFTIHLQLRFIVRDISPADYDEAILRRPEQCPLFYMGDMRRGQELLDGFDADAAAAAAAATALQVPVMSPIIGDLGGGGPLEQIAPSVLGLAAAIERAAGENGGRVSEEMWRKAVQCLVGRNIEEKN